MPTTKFAIIFHRFGPYHLARLRAARWAEVLAIEETAETSEYAWDAVASSGAQDGFTRETLLGPGERPDRPAAEIGRRLRAALDRFRPAAVVIPGWSDPAALAALDWGLANGVPAVIMSESTAGDGPRRAWREWLKSRVVRLGAAGLVGGTPHAAYLAALGVPRAQIFPGYDAVDNAHFAAGADAARAESAVTRARLGLPDRYFLASSRFVPQKNLPVLLAAFAAYRRAAGPAAWALVLLGDGPERETLRRESGRLGLDDGEALRLPGFQQYDALPAFYGLAGAFVHPATSEPWGLVVNEALASGLPVLVSERCGCAADLVKNGENGWTFDPKDPDALAARLAELATMAPAVRAGIGAAGRRHVADWGPEKFAQNLQRAVEFALAAPRPPGGIADRLLLRGLLARADAGAARLLPPASATEGEPAR